MNVLAFSIPPDLDWRWRIVSYNGDTVEESQMSFPTIAQAVAAGAARLQRDLDQERSRGRRW